MDRYYDRQGKPITLEAWCADFNDPQKKRVAYDETPQGNVSTVWLGLNHAFVPGTLAIFETLVFEGPLDGEMDRYATEEEAVAGHAAMLARVLASPPPHTSEEG